MKPNPSKSCLVIGSPVSHSISPRVHGAGYRALGIDHDFSMNFLDVVEPKLGEMIDRMRREPIRGFAVTKPLKEAMVPLLDWVSADVAEIGAANTVIKDGDVLKGYNTDWVGVVAALEEQVMLGKQKAVVLGAGGLAKAAVYGLRRLGAEVILCNRTVARGAALAERFKVRCARLDDRSEISKADIVLNATSVGMGEDVTPVDPDWLSPNQILFESVYHPRETTLLKAARARGLKTIPGMALWLHQAYAQFELMTGLPAPREIMKREADAQ